MKAIMDSSSGREPFSRVREWFLETVVEEQEDEQVEESRDAAVKEDSPAAAGIAYAVVIRDNTLLVEAGENLPEEASLTAREILNKTSVVGWDTYGKWRGIFKGLRFHVYQEIDEELVTWIFACVYDSTALMKKQVQSFLEKIVTISENFRECDEAWITGGDHSCQDMFAPILEQRMQEISYMGTAAIVDNNLDLSKEIIHTNRELLNAYNHKSEQKESVERELLKQLEEMNRKVMTSMGDGNKSIGSTNETETAAAESQTSPTSVAQYVDSMPSHQQPKLVTDEDSGDDIESLDRKDSDPSIVTLSSDDMDDMDVPEGYQVDPIDGEQEDSRLQGAVMGVSAERFDKPERKETERQDEEMAAEDILLGHLNAKPAQVDSVENLLLHVPEDKGDVPESLKEVCVQLESRFDDNASHLTEVHVEKERPCFLCNLFGPKKSALA